MTVEIPRDVRRLLPEDFAPEAVTACLSLTGGLSEAHVIAGDGRLIGFVKRSALDGLEPIELDPARPPPVEEVSWQPSLVLESLDGSRIPVPLPTMDKARTRAGIAALYEAIGASKARYALYAEALAETRGRSERLGLHLILAGIAEQIEPPLAIDHYAEMIALNPRDQDAVSGLERLYVAGFTAACPPLLVAHRALGDWARVVELERIRVEGMADAEARFAGWVEVADLARRRLDDPAIPIAALGRALAIRFDDGVLDHLERMVTSTGAWADGAVAFAQAAEGHDAPVAALWRRVAEARAERLGDAEGAIDAWRRVHEADPEAVDALLALARVHRAAEDWGRFLYMSRRALHLSADLADRITLLRAIAEVEEGPCERVDAAIAAWAALLEFATYDADALDALERLYPQTERWSELGELLARRQRVAEAALDDAAALVLIRRRARLTEEKLDDLDEAIRIWREVRIRAPRDAEAEVQIDRLLTTTEQWAALDGFLGERIEGAPAGIRVELNRRRACLLAEHLGDDGRALDAWRAVLNDAPADRPALVALIELLRATDRTDELIDALSALADVLPVDDPLRLKTRMDQARALMRVMGREDEAIAAWSTVLADVPDSVECMDALIDLYRADGQVFEAIPLIERRSRHADDPVPDLRLMAELLAEAEENEHAAAIYMRLLDHDARDRAARAALVEHFSTEARWPSLGRVLRDGLAVCDSDAERVESILQIAALELERLARPQTAMADLGAAPPIAWAERTFVDLAVRAAAAGADWRPLLAGAENQLGVAAIRDGVHDFAARLLPLVREDAAAACALGGWYEARDLPDRAIECYNAAITANPNAAQGLEGKRRALGAAGRWRLLVAHLEVMSRASLPRKERVDVLRHMAHVLSRHINAADDAAEAALRAERLAKGNGRTVLAVLFTVAALMTAVVFYLIGGGLI